MMSVESTSSTRVQAMPGGQGQASTCPHCGGSGSLRLGGQRYRTCLPCLGQGQLPALPAAITTADLATLRTEALQDATGWVGMGGCGLSAAVSGAAAR